MEVVRVFSLVIDAKEVDAFSMWYGGKPFVFLNTFKSAEHCRFDAAHELGHLVLHRHGQCQGPELEREANAFASAFLMPRKSVLSNGPTVMAFKEMKSEKTVEACVMAASGGMFKGYIRVVTKRGNISVGQTIGRGCGRPVKTKQAALELAEIEARRVLAK